MAVMCHFSSKGVTLWKLLNNLPEILSKTSTDKIAWMASSYVYMLIQSLVLWQNYILVNNLPDLQVYFIMAEDPLKDNVILTTMRRRILKAFYL